MSSKIVFALLVVLYTFIKFIGIFVTSNSTILYIEHVVKPNKGQRGSNKQWYMYYHNTSNMMNSTTRQDILVDKLVAIVEYVCVIRVSTFGWLNTTKTHKCQKFLILYTPCQHIFRVPDKRLHILKLSIFITSLYCLF